MEDFLSGGEGIGFAANHQETATNSRAPTSAAVDNGSSLGESSPEKESSPRDLDPCTCGFCDGVTVEHGYDPRTGEVESFERMSRRSRCPNCGGVNVQYRKSYTAHVAEVARREGRTRRAYFVTLVLDRDAADRAGIDGEASYQVLTGQRGVWTRSRRAVRRRDGEAVYVGTLSSRPSDGRWHAHVLLLTSLRRHELRKALHVTGADAYVSTPSGESHEQFGARKGAYAFDNAAKSTSARFISSRGKGVGYDSAAAVERRKEAVQDANENGEADPSTGARSLRRNQQREADGESGEREADTTEDPSHEAGESSTSGDRAPPVRCRGQTYDTLGAYLRAVKRILAARVGTRVYVSGLGNCTLLKVAHSRDGDGIACTVAPLDVEGDGAAVVRWREVAATNVPTVRQSMNRPNKTEMMDAATETGSPTGEDDPVQRFYDEARYSTVTTELDDGRRLVSVKDHDTGEVREHVKPPRENQ